MPPDPSSLPTTRPTGSRIERASQPDIDENAFVIGGFFDLSGAALAIQSDQFTLQEETSTLIGHIRSPDPNVSLRAQKQFRSLINDLAKANGLFGHVQDTVEKVGGDGTTLRRVQTTQRLMGAIVNRNTHASSPQERVQPRIQPPVDLRSCLPGDSGDPGGSGSDLPDYPDAAPPAGPGPAEGGEGNHGDAEVAE